MSENKPGVDEQFCPSCRAVVNQRAPYCPDCGHPISPENEAGATGGVSRQSPAEPATPTVGADDSSARAWGNVAKRAGLLLVSVLFFFASLGALLPGEGEPVEPVSGAVYLAIAVGCLGVLYWFTETGRTRTVEERSVVDPPEPCSACAAPVAEGVERERVTETVLFDSTLSRSTDGRSVYCRTCARGKVPDTVVPTPDQSGTTAPAPEAGGPAPSQGRDAERDRS